MYNEKERHPWQREKGRIEGAGDKENAGVECNDVLGKEKKTRGARRTEWKKEKDREKEKARKRETYCAKGNAE